MPLLALVVLPGPQFDNRPWPCVARHVDVAEPQMMAAPIHAFDDGIGRARQFVMQATFDQAAKHGIADLFVMDRERCNIRRAYLPTTSCRLPAVVLTSAVSNPESRRGGTECCLK